MSNTVWKNIVGFEGIYHVSNNGRVKSLSRWINHKGLYGSSRRLSKEREMSQYNDGYGYITVGLTKESLTVRIRVHVLVARAFIGERPEKMVIDHIDKDVKNNNASNLRYISHRENIARSKGEHNNVYWRKARNKWRVSFFVNGKTKSFGHFTEKSDAISKANEVRKTIDK